MLFVQRTLLWKSNERICVSSLSPRQVRGKLTVDKQNVARHHRWVLSPCGFNRPHTEV